MRRSGGAAELVLIAVIAYVIVLATIGMARHLLIPQPSSPWEASQVVEGWRAAQRLAVYEDPATGHATQMYGALAPQLLGIIFRITGPSFLAARLLALIAALTLTALVLYLFAGAARPFVLAIGTALIFGADTVSGSYFTAIRPDILALLIALIAGVLFYKSETRANLSLLTIGTALLIVAFFFKQPAAMAGGVPLVAALLHRDGRNARAIASSFIPIVAVVVTIILLKAITPQVAFYMLDVPRSYRLSVSELLTHLAKIIQALPVLWACIFVRARSGDAMQRMERWLLAALIVTIPLSAFTAAKAGGTVNSWLPAMLMGHAASIYLLARLDFSGAIEKLGLAALIFASAMQVHGNAGYLTRHADYAEVQTAIAVLRGSIAAPENPALLLGHPNPNLRNIYLETDAAPVNGGWSDRPPCYAWRDMMSARYVVDVKEWWADLLDSEVLRSNGYRINFQSDNYIIWEKPLHATAIELQCRG